MSPRNAEEDKKASRLLLGTPSGIESKRREKNAQSMTRYNSVKV